MISFPSLGTFIITHIISDTFCPLQSQLLIRTMCYIDHSNTIPGEAEQAQIPSRWIAGCDFKLQEDTKKGPTTGAIKSSLVSKVGRCHNSCSGKYSPLHNPSMYIVPICTNMFCSWKPMLSLSLWFPAKHALGLRKARKKGNIAKHLPEWQCFTLLCSHSKNNESGIMKWKWQKCKAWRKIISEGHSFHFHDF